MRSYCLLLFVVCGGFGTSSCMLIKWSADVSNQSSFLGKEKDILSTGKLDEIHESLLRAAQVGKLKKIKELFGKYPRNLDINCTWHKSEWSPLQEAGDFGRLGTVTFLIKNDADVNQKCSKGITPIMWAISNKNSVKYDLKKSLRTINVMVCQLIKRGADTMARDAEGLSIFDYVENESSLNSDRKQILRKCLKSAVERQWKSIGRAIREYMEPADLVREVFSFLYDEEVIDINKDVFLVQKRKKSFKTTKKTKKQK